MGWRRRRGEQRAAVWAHTAPAATSRGGDVRRSALGACSSNSAISWAAGLTERAPPPKTSASLRSSGTASRCSMLHGSAAHSHSLRGCAPTRSARASGRRCARARGRGCSASSSGTRRSTCSTALGSRAQGRLAIEYSSTSGVGLVPYCVPRQSAARLRIGPQCIAPATVTAAMRLRLALGTASWWAGLEGGWGHAPVLVLDLGHVGRVDHAIAQRQLHRLVAAIVRQWPLETAASTAAGAKATRRNTHATFHAACHTLPLRTEFGFPATVSAASEVGCSVGGTRAAAVRRRKLHATARSGCGWGLSRCSQCGREVWGLLVHVLIDLARLLGVDVPASGKPAHPTEAARVRVLRLRANLRACSRHTSARMRAHAAAMHACTGGSMPTIPIGALVNVAALLLAVQAIRPQLVGRGRRHLTAPALALMRESRSWRPGRSA